MDSTPPLSEELPHVVDRLTRRHPDLNRSVVDAVVRAQVLARISAPIQEFVPILVERASDEILSARSRSVINRKLVTDPSERTGSVQ